MTTSRHDLSRRMDALAARTSLTRRQIIEDALSHGRSLAWQEKWIAGVQAGIEKRLIAVSLQARRRSHGF